MERFGSIPCVDEKSVFMDDNGIGVNRIYSVWCGHQSWYPSDNILKSCSDVGPCYC